MTNISIFCTNPSSYPRHNEPVTIGVPFPKGQLPENSSLYLIDQNGSPVVLQARPLTRWPDGSIKWLLCDFLANLPSSAETVFELSHDAQVFQEGTSLIITKDSNSWSVDTGAAVFGIDTREFRPFSVVEGSNGQLLVGLSETNLIDGKGQRWTPRIENLVLESEGPVRATIFFSGIFHNGNDELLRFESRLSLYSGLARVMLEMRLHNPWAARHPDNLWDLGDPSSVMLQEWSLFFPALNSGHSLRLIKVGDGHDWREMDQSGGRLYQESSGGKNWESPVHRNRSGNVPLTFSGWRLKEGSQVVADGLRAQPCLWWKNAEKGITASIDAFWQRFPKAVELNKEGICLSLLPAEFPGGHEVLGGEQITETVRLDFDAQGSGLAWGYPTIHVRCAYATYRNAGVFPQGLWTPENENYKKLLDTALNSKKGFKAKREQVDEYGWRNFGELYADHESAFYQGDVPFVSHYNNQYDPLYSFYRLFFTTGNPAWGELACELAAHIADIDIYHTDKDREEYNNGLFWHTDHYLDAGLCTHRSVSREHLKYKDPAFCGGGPGAEHCYSGGLALHYLVTGNPRSKKLVLDLADWIWISLHGPQTVGAAALRCVKSAKRLRAQQGQPWSRYPFTRGTGNCLNTTLDAFELTGDVQYLTKATRLIKGTVFPTDNPDERDLLNAELCWSYTVFLGALGRYLNIKQLWGQLDADFSHARGSLITYADWMVNNEYPYLDKPEILEYPNETWAAQDLRKGVVLFYAAKFSEGVQREIFLDKAGFFLTNGLDTLISQPTHFFTRPLVLLMQNGWTVEALQKPLKKPSFSSENMSSKEQMPRVNSNEFILRTFSDFRSVLPGTNLKREWSWFKARLRK